MRVSPEAAERSTYGIREARIDLAAAHRLADRDGLSEGTWNHLSLSVPGDPGRMLVSPADVHFSLVRACDLSLLGPDVSEVEAIGGRDWTAYCLHYPIHQLHPEADCVLHVHPPYATAISMMKDGRLEMASQNAMLLWNRIAYTEEYDGAEPLGLAAGEQLAETLGDKHILFMRNHGVLVVGRTVASAYWDLYLLERACLLQFIASSSGGQLAIASDEVCALAAPAGIDETMTRNHFEAMKRVLDREQSDYAQLS